MQRKRGSGSLQKLRRSSVVLAALGEAAAAHICRQGKRLAGLCHEADPFEEARPDAFFSRCCGWSHAAPHCPAVASRCSFCKEVHQISDHRCPGRVGWVVGAAIGVLGGGVRAYTIDLLGTAGSARH